MTDEFHSRYPEGLLTVGQVAAMFELSRWTVRRMILAGELPAVDVSASVSGKHRFRVRESDARHVVTRRYRPES